MDLTINLDITAQMVIIIRVLANLATVLPLLSLAMWKGVKRTPNHAQMTIHWWLFSASSYTAVAVAAARLFATVCFAQIQKTSQNAFGMRMMRMMRRLR